MYRQRCQICTGCGRCPGSENRISIVTRPPAGGPAASLKNPEGKRLVAADIGTTTIAMQLFGEDGEVRDEFVSVNPQREYGADVISRIQAAKDPVSAERMRLSVRDVLKRGLERFRGQTGDRESLFLVIAANTAMAYLLMGYDPGELGRAPFAASRLETARIELEGIPGVVLPGFSAFLGGDIAAGIHACGMAEGEEIVLFIDLGTNGEMALGNRSRILACAAAAGPAFEGGVNRGVWGADMVSLLAGLRREGVLDETGLLAEPWFEGGIRIGGVLVTQEAVRAVQLAKGAILAGIHILAKRYGVPLGKIDKVVLAGGFGYYLNPRDAGEIGLFPRELSGRAKAGGNTALAGAARLGEQILCQGYPEDYLETLAGGRGGPVEVLNLACQPEFDRLYIRSMELQG